MNDTLQKALKKLRLSGLAQTLDVRLQEAAGNGLNHAEFLDIMTGKEIVALFFRQDGNTSSTFSRIWNRESATKSAPEMKTMARLRPGMCSPLWVFIQYVPQRGNTQWAANFSKKSSSFTFPKF